MGLSVCMIVRNESALLPRCLSSLRGVYDELCIVDTGSNDTTIEVAREWGAQVTQCLTCNGPDGRIVDFASPRNQALAMSTQSWVLQIDADEVVLEGQSRIRAYTKTTEQDAVAVFMRSSGAEWFSVRLFRRNVAEVYRSRIHEYLVYSGKMIKSPSVVIENLEDKTGKEPASDRNIRLCLQSLLETPNEGRIHHYLGNEYRSIGEYEKAIASYEAALQANNFISGLFYSAYYQGICHMLTGNWEQAAKSGKRAMTLDMRRAEGCCLIADAAYCAGAHASARRWYLAALDLGAPPDDSIMPCQIWAYGEHPRKQIMKIDAQLAGGAHATA